MEKTHLPALLYKVRKQDGKHALASIGQSTQLMLQLPSQLGTIQISVKSTAFYPYFGFYSPFISCQSRDKMLQILLRFVLYPTMMVAIALARQIGQCWQVHAFYLVSLLFIAMLASVSFPSCFVTFCSSGRSLLPFFKS